MTGRRQPPDKVEPCGTAAAYRRHLRHGEDACDECKAAHARAKARRQVERRARRRAIG